MSGLQTSDITLLGIDTSGKSASCAIVKDGELIAETTFLTNLTHSQIILPILVRTLDDCSLKLEDIDIFACSAGPGSYTGLRIAIAAIKGICALGKLCVGVSTLEAMVYNAAQKGAVVPIMSARAGVVYYGAYSFDGNIATPLIPSDKVGEESELKELIKDLPGDILLCGDCAERIKAELFSDNASVAVTSRGRRVLSAYGVCMAALAHRNEWCGAEELRARYLQDTMAEKLKKFNGIG